MIPEEKKAAVASALQETFGVAQFSDIRRMTKGLSSDLVFRIVVDEMPYLLRIMTRMDEQMDPKRIFACMNAAAAAGLTPRVKYSNAEDGISITDFVEAVMFPATQAIILLPGTLRRLHALPLFPKAFNWMTPHNYFIWRFRKAGLLPKEQIEEAFPQYENICAIYPRLDADMVSCHMDLKPENILFDGQRVWLVDWQAAFVNDRYFDLAVFANFVVSNDADEWKYLEQYFGERPDEYQRARFFLMRQMVHMFYAAVFLLLGSVGNPIDLSEKLPSFRDFHRRIWEGGANFADNVLKIIYGRVHWEQLLQNVRQARFDEALRIVSERHGNEQGVSRLMPAAQ
jgi:aminoglycoside phosphotransferase (APT) family kinase protein